MKQYKCSQCCTIITYNGVLDKRKKLAIHKTVCFEPCRFCEGEGCSICNLTGVQQGDR